MRMSPPRSRLRISGALLAFSASLTLLFLGGCTGPHRPGPRHEPPEPPQAVLEGNAVFLAGTVQASLRVTPFMAGRHPGENRPGGDEGGEDRAPPGGGRGGGPRGGMGGGRGPGGGMGEGGLDDEGPSEGGGRPSRGGPHAGGMAGMTMPRQTLVVSFTNRSDSPVSFVVAELRSAIGNFAPSPRRLTLEPGDSASLEPVSGDAGGAVDALDVTLTLRQPGTTDTQAVPLRPMRP